jgi:hypothetical protein
MAFGRKKTRQVVPINGESRVGDVIEAWPETLSVLLDLGFEPLRNPIARKTVARLFTVRQAASFKSVEVADLVHTLRVAIGQEEPTDRTLKSSQVADTGTSMPPLPGSASAGRLGVVQPAAAGHGPDHVCGPGESDIPELDGDIRVIGLVPCPVRGILVEAFDRFAGQMTVDTGKRIAWWLAGEGTAIGDTREWLDGIHKRNEPERLPDVLVMVGTELFCYPKYGGLARSGVYGPFPGERHPRPDLAPLEDPDGVLGLLFVGLFTMICRPERLPGGRLPTSWRDLADPALVGEVGFPSLHLPIVPDLMAVLHAELGEDDFVRFARNLGATMHPAQAAPRAHKQDIPGITIVPTLFSQSGEVIGGVEVIPEEGPIAVPAYGAVRRDACPEAAQVASFLASEAFLAPCWEHGQFLPNHSGVEAALPRGTALSRPWETVRGAAPGAESDRLLAILEGRA